MPKVRWVLSHGFYSKVYTLSSSAKILKISCKEFKGGNFFRDTVYNTITRVFKYNRRLQTDTYSLYHITSWHKLNNNSDITITLTVQHFSSTRKTVQTINIKHFYCGRKFCSTITRNLLTWHKAQGLALGLGLGLGLGLFSATLAIMWS